jgi:Transposase, Mutator family
MDFASWKDRKAIAAALKTIYRGKDTDAGRQALDEFDAGPWGKKYPAIAQRWRRNWEHVIPSAEMEIEKWRAETGARNPPRTDRNAGNCRLETGARQPNLRECRGETGYRGAGGVPPIKAAAAVDKEMGQRGSYASAARQKSTI